METENNRYLLVRNEIITQEKTILIQSRDLNSLQRMKARLENVLFNETPTEFTYTVENSTDFKVVTN